MGVLRVGAVCGLLAGAVFALHLALIAEVSATPTPVPGVASSTWTPFSGIASFIFGARAFHGSLTGWAPLGLAVHLAVAMLVGTAGAVWVWICLGELRNAGLALGLGAAFGLFVEVVAMNLVVNPVESPDLVYGSLPRWAWWAGHVVYGAVLGLLVNRRLAA